MDRGPRTPIVNDISFDDPCILFALQREARAFLREFRPQQRFPGAPCLARFCGPSWLTVLVLETGVGAARTEAAVKWLLGQPVLGNVPYRPKVILSAGFCGALQEQSKVGDVILATEIADTDGNRWPTTWPGELPAGEWRPPLHRGRMLTTHGLAASAEEKQTLGRQHEALAVDMEAAVVARRCSKQGIPFGCVRAVSDEMSTSLSPKLLPLVASGRVSPFKAAATLATSPGLAKEMWWLAKQTQHASEQLGKALGELLTLTLPFSVE
jgi:adenosylhomocysteine nucleosidase